LVGGRVYNEFVGKMKEVASDCKTYLTFLIRMGATAVRLRAPPADADANADANAADANA